MKKISVQDFLTSQPVSTAFVCRDNIFEWRHVEADGSIEIPPDEMEIQQGKRIVKIRSAGYFDGVLEVDEPNSDEIFYLHSLHEGGRPWWATFYEIPRSSGDQIKVGIIDSGCGEHELLPHVERYGFGGPEHRICRRESPLDLVGHGTPIAGFIGAKAKTAPPFAGCLSDAKLISVRITDRMRSKEPAVEDRLIAALEFLTSEEVDIINLSLRSGEVGDKNGTTIVDALDDALDAGIILVAAAGNHSHPYLEFPACHPGVIAISAFGRAVATPENTVCHFDNAERILEALDDGNDLFKYINSNQSPRSFWCPGVATVSTFPPAFPSPNNGFKEMDGTSFACAIATGVIGGILQEQKTHLDTFQGINKVREVGRILQARSQMRGDPAFRVLL